MLIYLVLYLLPCTELIFEPIHSCPIYFSISLDKVTCYSLKLLGFYLILLLLFRFLQGGYASNGASIQSDGDSSNTTVSFSAPSFSFNSQEHYHLCPLANHIVFQIFVGGLDPNVTEEDLRQPFSQYGEIVSVKIPFGKGCGFVQFGNR